MWTLFGALAGGDSPQSASISRSVETTSRAFRSRRARSARCLPLPTGSDRPFSATSTGPRMRNSLLASGVAVTAIASRERLKPCSSAIQALLNGTGPCSPRRAEGDQQTLWSERAMRDHTRAPPRPRPRSRRTDVRDADEAERRGAVLLARGRRGPLRGAGRVGHGRLLTSVLGVHERSEGLLRPGAACVQRSAEPRESGGSRLAAGDRHA